MLSLSDFGNLALRKLKGSAYVNRLKALGEIGESTARAGAGDIRGLRGPKAQALMKYLKENYPEIFENLGKE